MKTLLIASAVAVTALAGAASAATTNTHALNQIERYVPNADLSSLSNAQLVAVAQKIDSASGAANKTAEARALIKAFN
mgnify:CR=1 FL=1